MNCVVKKSADEAGPGEGDGVVAELRATHFRANQEIIQIED